MIREVDLVSYLPPFLAEYKETNLTLTAENPEFILGWKAADRVLKNEFIATADEYGIERFEKILHILPSRNDTLESRRSRIQSRWITALPYTWQMFIQKLLALCGGNEFTITKQFDFYRIKLDVHLPLFGQVEELERIVENMLPCNMVVDAHNLLASSPKTKIFLSGTIQQTAHFTINTELGEKKVLQGDICHAGYVSMHKTMEIATDATKEDIP